MKKMWSGTLVGNVKEDFIVYKSSGRSCLCDQYGGENSSRESTVEDFGEVPLKDIDFRLFGLYF